MKFLFVLFSLMMSVLANANTLVFSETVMKLRAPFTTSDVLNGNTSFDTLPWPKHLYGWISQEQVEHWLREQQIETAPIQWEGPKRVWISWCHPVPIEGLNNLVNKRLDTIFLDYEAELISVEQISKRLMPCTDTPITQVIISSVELTNSGSVKITLDLFDNTVLLKNHIVNVNLVAYVTGWFLTSNEDSGTHFNDLALRKEKVKWQGSKLLQPNILGNFMLQKRMKADQELKHSDLVIIPDVSLGQEVKVIVRHQGIEIVTKGRAMSNAHIGQLVKVRVKDSQVLSEAKVVAKGVVNVSV